MAKFVCYLKNIPIIFVLEIEKVFANTFLACYSEVSIIEVLLSVFMYTCIYMGLQIAGGNALWPLKI